MLDEISAHAEGVSSLGGSAILPLLILALNWAFSAIHVFEGWKGSKFLLWRAFGAIEGLYVPNWLGFPFFTVLLLLILWIAGVTGIVGWGVIGWSGFWPSFGWVSEQQGVFWIGFILGALVSDSIFS